MFEELNREDVRLMLDLSREKLVNTEDLCKRLALVDIKSFFELCLEHEMDGVVASHILQNDLISLPDYWMQAYEEEKKYLTFIRDKAADLITASAMRIPTCVSHGDFQGGNIWVDDRGKTWLYDWETVGRRSVWYDSAVLQYSLRRVYGWQDFLQENLPAGICGCDPEKIRTEAQMTVIKAVILLEDMVFYLEDMLELPKDWGTQIFDDFAARMWGLWNDR